MTKAKNYDEVNREFAGENYLYYAPEKIEETDGKENTENINEDNTLSLNEGIGEGNGKSKRPRSPIADYVSNILFYGCLIVVFLGAFFFSQQGTGGTSFLGFHMYQVLSESMQSVYPKGSLVVVKAGDIDTIEAGDDITFMVSPTDTATHRCIEVIEDYEGSGQTVYRTQGVDNPTADSAVVYQNNIIGKVIFCVPVVGAIMRLISGNLIFVLFIAIAIIILSIGIKLLWGETTEYRNEQKEIRRLKKMKKKALAEKAKLETASGRTEVDGEREGET